MGIHLHSLAALVLCCCLSVSLSLSVCVWHCLLALRTQWEVNSNQPSWVTCHTWQILRRTSCNKSLLCSRDIFWQRFDVAVRTTSAKCFIRFIFSTSCRDLRISYNTTRPHTARVKTLLTNKTPVVGQCFTAVYLQLCSAWNTVSPQKSNHASICGVKS